MQLSFAENLFESILVQWRIAVVADLMRNKLSLHKIQILLQQTANISYNAKMEWADNVVKSLH